MGPSKTQASTATSRTPRCQFLRGQVQNHVCGEVGCTRDAVQQQRHTDLHEWRSPATAPHGLAWVTCVSDAVQQQHHTDLCEWRSPATVPHRLVWVPETSHVATLDDRSHWWAVVVVRWRSSASSKSSWCILVRCDARIKTDIVISPSRIITVTHSNLSNRCHRVWGTRTNKCWGRLLEVLLYSFYWLSVTWQTRFWTQTQNNYRTTVIGYQTINYQTTVIRYQTTVIGYQTTVIRYQTTHTARHYFFCSTVECWWLRARGVRNIEHLFTHR